MVRVFNPRPLAYMLLAAAVAVPALVLSRALARVSLVGDGKGLVGVVFLLSLASTGVLALANWQIAVAYRAVSPPRSVWLHLERGAFLFALVVTVFPALAFLLLALLRRIS